MNHCLLLLTIKCIIYLFYYYKHHSQSTNDEKENYSVTLLCNLTRLNHDITVITTEVTLLIHATHRA